MGERDQILRMGERQRSVQVQRHDFCTGGCCIEGQQLPHKMGGLIGQIHFGPLLTSVELSFRSARIKRLTSWPSDPAAVISWVIGRWLVEFGTACYAGATG